MARPRLSPSAERDLDEIDLQTIERFGFDQAERTLLAIEKALTDIQDSPGIGHHREDLDPAGQSYLYLTVLRRFVIVYRVRTDTVEVARILDGVRDLRGIMSEDLP